MALPANYRTPPVPAPLFGRRPSVSTVSETRHKGASSSQTCNPFMQGQPGHPAFAAARFARLAETQDSGNKPIKAPKAPLMPYMRYSKKMWDHVKAANPRIKSIPDIGKMIGKMWQDLSEEERKEYEMEYELDKAQYQEALHNYHNSTAYQEWVKKEEMRKLQLAQEAEEKKNISSRVGVVQADDDDDNIFSLKHLASARYSRNHLLMAEIFSDTVVPDMRQVVFGKKLTTLRQQREGLEQTLSTRQTELKTAEEKHDNIRKKIAADRERWDSVWADACAKKPKLTDELFDQLTARARLEIRDKVRQQQQQILQQNPAKNPQQPNGTNGTTVETPASTDGNAADNDNEPVGPAAGGAARVSHHESVPEPSVAPVEPTRVEVVNVERPVESSATTTSPGTDETILPAQNNPVPSRSSETAGQLECLDVNRVTQPSASVASSMEISSIVAPMMPVASQPLVMESTPVEDIAMNDPDDEADPSTSDDQPSPFAVGSQDSIPVGGDVSSSVATDDVARLPNRPGQSEETDEDEEIESEDGEAEVASSASSLPVVADQQQRQAPSSNQILPGPDAEEDKV